MIDDIKEELAALLADASGAGKADALASLEPGKVGDISSRLAFALAMSRSADREHARLRTAEGDKEKKENPAKLAAQIAAKLPKNAMVEKAEAAGPYINFYLSGKAYAKLLADVLAKKDRYGMGRKKKGKTIMEFPSVNPNKPWHIGHLRNAVLGESVARMLEFEGHQVERMDYIDDLGLQVAQSLWGFLNYDSSPQGKFDSWLGHQYVGIAKKFEEDKNVVEGVRDLLKSMEEGDNETAKAGRDLAERCVRAQYETAFAFGVHHDALVFESDIMRTIFAEGIKLIKSNDAVELEKEGKNAGCWVVKLGDEFEKEFGKMENPDKVLVRSDGTAVYTGKDVIFHLWKFGKLKSRFRYEPFIEQPNGRTAYKTSPSKPAKEMDFGNATRVINVIGVEQKYPQRVIAEVFRRLRMGKEAEGLQHLSYEHVGLPDEKFSGRKGTWVGFTADELLAEAETRVMEKVKLDVPEAEKRRIARAVGVGAIKFSFLRTSSEKRITFKWDEALSMEGNSGPYVQYAYVRTNGILAKAEGQGARAEIRSESFNESEKQLLKKLAIFNDLVARSSRDLAPHHVAQYVLEVAADFTAFYGSSPVLAAESAETRDTRLAITLATGIVIRNGLGLLGIDCPERM
ncbi:MAG: arginine--tRNA ligase [Candidatus ainarchaeum sp.]|nr:arginine--tRNA ligase [Candidatus ainarchaeum sp.]